MKKLLSVCMIVKNEEEVLERCLQSIHGIADEIIIVDTGSTDNTKQIATKYTDKFYEIKWENDFSKARNYAASKASGEWILVIDADEYVDRESFNEFKKQLSLNPPVEEINAVQIVNFVGEEANNTTLNHHTRLYRNNGLIEFNRPIHEVLQYKDKETTVVGYVDLQIYHSGYMKQIVKEKQKNDRNLSLLLKKEEKSGIDYFYIGNEYKSLGNMKKAIEYYQAAYKNRESDSVAYLTKLLVLLIDALYSEKRFEEALQVIKGCEEAYPHYADYKYYKGLICLAQKKNNQAKAVFEYILTNKDILVVDHSEDYKEYLPLINLASIYEEEGELHKAVEYYSKAISLNETNDVLWSRLLYLLGKHSSLEELTGFINRKVVTSRGMNELRMIKILLNVPILNIQKLSRSLLDNENLTELENEALLIKNYLLDLNFEEVHRLIENKTVGELTIILQKSIFTISDLIILVHENNNESVFEKLKKLSMLIDISDLFKLFFIKKHGKLKLNNREKNIFIECYRQAIVLGIEKVTDKLDKKIFLLDENSKNEIIKIRKL